MNNSLIITKTENKVKLLENFFKILGRNLSDVEKFCTGIDSYGDTLSLTSDTLSNLNSFLKLKLEEQKHKHFGVFLCPNRFRGNRNNKNVYAITSLFCDIDVKDDNKETKDIILNRILNANICPSIIIKTKSGFHCYWPTNDISLGEFDRYQNALHEYLNKNFLSDLLNFDPKKEKIVTVVCDPKVKAKSALIRVPFFLHMKDANNPLEILPIKMEDKKFSKDFFNSFLHFEQNADGNKKFQRKTAIIKLKEEEKEPNGSTVPPLTLISNLDIHSILFYIQEQIGINSKYKTIIDQNEFFYIINRVDLRKAFGIRATGIKTNLKCLLHSDNKPSASMFRGEDGVWFYKCHSSNCSHDAAMTNFDLICNLLGYSKKQLLKEMEVSFNLCFNKEYNDKVQNLIQNNKKFLQFSSKYPMLCKQVSGNTRLVLLKILDLISNNITTDELEIDGRPGMFISMEYLSKVTKIEKRTVHRIFCYLCAIGLLRREKWNKIPENFKPKTIRHSQFGTQITYISLPKYSKGFMEQCNSDATKLYNNGIISPRSTTMVGMKYACAGKYFYRCFDEHCWSLSQYLDIPQEEIKEYEQSYIESYFEKKIYTNNTFLTPDRMPRGSSPTAFFMNGIEMDLGF